MLARLVLLVAGAGLIGSTVFLVLVVAAVARFRRKYRPQIDAAQQHPPVTLLKPVCGLEPRLEENLESFFQQDYPAYEIIFGARTDDDAALAVARKLSRRYPHIPVKVVLSGEPDRPNAKVCSLVKMVKAARYDYLIVSDSDVHVTPAYIREVVRPLLQDNIGLVTCLYRGVPTGGLWSRMEALGMSVEMTSGVVVADMLEGMKFALGPTMAIRRDVLEKIGGMGVLADYCADDYVLGLKVFEAGHEVVMSSHVIDHVVLNRSFRKSIEHQVRWMKSTRFSRPHGHIGSGLTFAVPFGLLGGAAAAAIHHPVLGGSLFVWALLNRMVMSVMAGGLVVRDRRAVYGCWLYPLRDLMGFFFWAASFTGTTIVWRQERYRLLPGGLMTRVNPKPAQEIATVDG